MRIYELMNGQTLYEVRKQCSGIIIVVTRVLIGPVSENFESFQADRGDGMEKYTHVPSCWKKRKPFVLSNGVIFTELATREQKKTLQFEETECAFVARMPHGHHESQHEDDCMSEPSTGRIKELKGRKG